MCSETPAAADCQWLTLAALRSIVWGCGGEWGGKGCGCARRAASPPPTARRLIPAGSSEVSVLAASSCWRRGSRRWAGGPEAGEPQRQSDSARMLTSRQASALCALALQNSFQNLIVRYSRVGGASGGGYIASTAVLLTECTKVAVSVVALLGVTGSLSALPGHVAEQLSPARKASQSWLMFGSARRGGSAGAAPSIEAKASAAAKP